MNTYFDKNIKNLIVAVLALLALFLLVASVALLANVSINKKGIMPANTITVRATGEAIATPDIATFSYTVREESSEVTAVQQMMTEKGNRAIAYLKENGVEDKDIKTESYTTNPRYDYVEGRQMLAGYEAQQTVSVKVRDVAKAGELLTGISSLSIGEVSSLSFTIDDDATLKAEAKADAINKAMEDAEKTTENLNVSLGKIVGFYEEYPMDPGYPSPVEFSSMKAMNDTSIAPSIQTGEQKIMTTISITFEVN